MIRKIIKFILIVVWMGLIFSFSSDNATTSTNKSDGVIIKIVQVFKNDNLTTKEKEYWTNKLVVPIRKGAHFFVYFILGLLVISFLKEYGSIDKKRIALAILVTFLYACSDEVHQLFVPGRSGQISDVLLDTFAGIISIISYGIIYNKIGKRGYSSE